MYKDAMLPAILGRMNKDENESKLVNAGLITLSSDAGQTIASSISSVTTTLMPLVDKANGSSGTQQSAFAAKLEAVSLDILESYSRIARANADLASQ
jgi:hypothetical protein